MKRVLNPGLSLWLSALYDVMVMLGSVHSQHTLFFLFRPLPGLKPTPRDMAHRRWDLPAGCFSSQSVFCCDDFLINGSHEAPWRVCLERLENTETSKKKKKTFCSLQCWRKPAAECSVSRFSVFSAAFHQSTECTFISLLSEDEHFASAKSVCRAQTFWCNTHAHKPYNSK